MHASLCKDLQADDLGPYAFTPKGHHCVGENANRGYRIGQQNAKSGFRNVRATSCLNPNPPRFKSQCIPLTEKEKKDVDFLKNITRKDSFHNKNPEDIDPLAVKMRAYRNSAVACQMKLPAKHKISKSEQRDSLHDSLIENLAFRPIANKQTSLDNITED